MTEPSHGEATEQKTTGANGDEWIKYKYCRSCHAHTELPTGGATAWWKEHWHTGEFDPRAWTAYWLDRYCADLVQKAEHAIDEYEASAAAAPCETEADYDPYQYDFAEVDYRQASRIGDDLRPFVVDADMLRLRDWDTAKLARFACTYADHEEALLCGVGDVASALRDLLEFARWVEAQGCAFPRGLDAFRGLKDVPEVQLPVERALWLEWVSAVMGSSTAWSDFILASIPTEFVEATRDTVAGGGGAHQHEHMDSCPVCRRLHALPTYEFGPPPTDDSILF